MKTNSFSPTNKSKTDGILDAACTLFAERGYDCTPIAEIAEMAGVAAGTIIYHFKRKERLLAELAMRHLRGLNTHCWEQSTRGSNGLDSVLLFINAYHEYLKTHSKECAAYFKNLPGEKLKSSKELSFDVAAAERNQMMLLHCLLILGLNDGTISAASLESCARSILAQLQGSMLMVLFQNANPEVMARDAVSHARVLLTSVPPTSPQAE